MSDFEIHEPPYIYKKGSQHNYCYDHFVNNCEDCINKSKEAEVSSKKPLIEVKAIEVHKVVSFLNYGRHTVKSVKYCPKCFMPNLIGSGSYNTLTVICDTCDAMWLNPDKELGVLDVDSYLQLIRSLPLLNRGKIILSLQEKQKHANDPAVTYDDLSEEDLHKYDELVN